MFECGFAFLFTVRAAPVMIRVNVLIFKVFLYVVLIINFDFSVFADVMCGFA